METENRKVFSVQCSGVSGRYQVFRRGTVCFVVKAILICLLGGFAVAPTLGDSRIDADGVLHVDGQRRFPLGLYQHVADADLGKALATAGILTPHPQATHAPHAESKFLSVIKIKRLSRRNNTERSERVRGTRIALNLPPGSNPAGPEPGR